MQARASGSIKENDRELKIDDIIRNTVFVCIMCLLLKL